MRKCLEFSRSKETAVLYYGAEASEPLETTIRHILQRVTATLCSDDGVAALDSSGWARSYASQCYTQRIKLKIKALKVTLLVDTKIQTVLDLHVAPALVSATLAPL